jgi:hypothetical protein
MTSRLRANRMEARVQLIRPHGGSNPARSASESRYTAAAAEMPILTTIYHMVVGGELYFGLTPLLA